VALSAIGIFLVGVIVSVTSIWPLYQYIKKEEERSLLLALNTKTAVVEEYLARARDISQQISCRTQARKHLELYNEGKLNLDQVVDLLQPSLADAISLSHEVWGLSRLDKQGKVVIELGLEIPPDAWPGMETDSRAPSVLGPITVGRRPYLVVVSPIINREGSRVGTDLVLFRLFRLKQIVADITGLGLTGETILGVVNRDRVDVIFPFDDDRGTVLRRESTHSAIGLAMQKAALKQSGILVPQRHIGGNDVIAYGPIKDSPWGIAVKKDENELYAPINRQIVASAYLILSLILLGSLIMVLILRPVAGQVIIHTDELMRQIEEKTASLQKELAERNRIQQWLSDSERRYRTLVEEVPDVIFILDRDGRFTYTNTQVEKFLELPVREILETRLKDHVVPEHQDRIDQIFQLAPESIWDEEVGLMDAHGRYKWTRIRCKALAVQDESLIRYEGVMRDITLRRGLEKELKASREELLEKIRIIDDLYEHIVQSGKAKAIADHTAEVAHELRQPLAIIGGFARRIERKFDSCDATDIDSQRQYCRFMISEVERLERILVNLIDFTKRESLRLEKSDPNAIIRNVLKVYRDKMQEKNIQLETRIGEEVGEILLDHDRFEQVVRNLLSNAVEASPEGNPIQVETGASIPSGKAHETGGLEAETYFEMKISNFGKIILPEDLKKIFSPFYTTKDFGTGIGLTLAKRIVQDHKGSISVKSDEDGTVFTVWLPIVQPATEQAVGS
jgi:PAS domain S-box-containing protein